MILRLVVGLSLGYTKDRNINSTNINFGIGLLSGTISLDPNTYKAIGGSIGVGAGFGGSITTTGGGVSCPQ